MPTRRDGRICITLDLTEGAHGTLYVANTGRPFTARSFAAICEFAQSSKLPGESIGNKGIGFRSVLQIADRPEVYSRAPRASGAPRERFDGYCFRFAHAADIATHADPELAQAIAENVSPYSLPFPADEQAPSVRGAAMDGYATVVRLPLRSEQAAGEAVASLEACVDSAAPLPLFLERLKTLDFTLRHRDSHRSVQMVRWEKPLDVGNLPRHVFKVSRVTIRVEDQTVRRKSAFLVASEWIPESTMLGAIQESIAHARLPVEWRAWKGESRVSVAVGERAEEVSRLYNYLPMGESATSPFAGLLNAPFFSKLDRRSLDLTVPLNDLLMTRGASVCLRFAEALAGTGSPEFGPTVARLTAWSEPERRRLVDVSLAHGAALSARRLVPVMGRRTGRQRYVTLQEAFTWTPREPTAVFSSERLAEMLRIGFLDPRIEEPVRARLDALRVLLVGTSFEPEHGQLAVWAEQLAKALSIKRAAIPVWDALYADLAAVFALRPHALLLQGRRLLLSEDGGLLRAGPVEAASSTGEAEPVVFLPPVRTRIEDEEDVPEDADIEIPRALSPFVTYTHPALQWRTPDSETSTRPFFAEHRLVRRFRRRELRELLRSVLSQDRDDVVYAAALEFAYRLVGSTPDQAEPKPGQLNLRVPTIAGRWIPAEEAVFSESWGTPSAGSLATLLRSVAGRSPELDRYADDLLAFPQDWPFAIERDAFKVFLRHLDVKDGLWPVYSSLEPSYRYGYAWLPQSMSQELGQAQPTATAWQLDVTNRGEFFEYPSYPYEVGPVPSVPGQDTYHTWSDTARDSFAELIAMGLGAWPDEALWCTFSKLGGRRDNKSWPSPVLAFLTHIAWIPMGSGASATGLEFETPPSSWLPSEYAESLPDFMPAVRLPVRRAILTSAKAKDRLRRLLGGRYWGDPADAAGAVVALGTLLAEGKVEDSAYGSFAAIYQQKWHDLFAAGQPEALRMIAMSATLVVRRAGQLATWRADEVGGPIVLVDDIAPLRRQLIEETHAAVFAVDPVDATVHRGSRQLRGFLGDRARLSSEIAFEVTADGLPFIPSDRLPYLRDTALASVAELAALYVASRAAVHSHRAREAALEHLQQVRMALATEITVTVTGLEQATTTRPRALAYPHSSHPTLLACHDLLRGGVSAHELAQPICELVGLPAASGGLELVLRRAHDRLGTAVLPDGFVSLPAEIICGALELTPERLREIRSLIQRPLSACVRLLVPVVCFALGEDWSDESYEAMTGATTPEELQSALAAVAGRLPCDIEELLVISRLESGLADIRDRLGLPFGGFNAALRRLGRGYSPLVDPEAHGTAFIAFLARKHTWTNDQLRRKFWSAFSQGGPLDAYVSARDHSGLVADAAWTEEYAIPPEDVMERHLDQWLATQGRDIHGDIELQALDHLRRANKQFLDDVQERLRDVVTTWCARNSAAVPSWWGEQPAGASWLSTASFAEGWLDFAAVDEELLLHRLAAQGRWPAAMPPTLNLQDLGLAAADLDRSQTRREAEKLQREVARRSVTIDGTPVLVEIGDYRLLADAVLGRLEAEVLDVPDRPGPLSIPDPRTRASGIRKNVGAVSTRTLSDEQRLGVGFAGELVVREWLRRLYPELDIDEHWRSGYKNAFLGRMDGDDSLGYDFEIVTSARRRLYEVKSSLGEEWQFALGESEVRVAQRFSADQKTHYRVIYVANVLNSTARQLIVLPNPFSQRGADLLRVIGEGMRFRFTPT